MERTLKLVVGASAPRPQPSREPSDVPKATCPWCGSQRSTVYRSKGAMNSDAYRRRRRCADCTDATGTPRTWPTLEELDRVRFLRELAAQGVDPAELGLEPAYPTGTPHGVPALPNAA